MATRWKCVHRAAGGLFDAQEGTASDVCFWTPALCQALWRLLHSQQSCDVAIIVPLLPIREPGPGGRREHAWAYVLWWQGRDPSVKGWTPSPTHKTVNVEGRETSWAKSGHTTICVNSHVAILMLLLKSYPPAERPGAGQMSPRGWAPKSGDR